MYPLATSDVRVTAHLLYHDLWPDAADTPRVFHPNEILDGAITGPYRTALAMSWTVANNPVLLDLYRRHGVDWNFLGVIALRTEWTTQHEKQLMANQTAKLAQMLGAQVRLSPGMPVATSLSRSSAPFRRASDWASRRCF